MIFEKSGTEVIGFDIICIFLAEEINIEKNLSHDTKKPTKWLCAQWRLISAWAFAQSDQCLRCALSAWLRAQAFFMRTAETLIRLGKCPGWSESSLGAHSFCWFCHVAAHLFSIYSQGDYIIANCLQYQDWFSIYPEDCQRILEVLQKMGVGVDI